MTRAKRDCVNAIISKCWVFSVRHIIELVSHSGQAKEESKKIGKISTQATYLQFWMCKHLPTSSTWRTEQIGKFCNSRRMKAHARSCY